LQFAATTASPNAISASRSITGSAPRNDRALAEALLGQLLIERGAIAEARVALERALRRPCKPEVAKAIEEAAKSLPAE
jgi:hypothetical protein